jgi:hypothetical protein
MRNMNFDILRAFEDSYPGLTISAELGSVDDYLQTIAEYLPLIKKQSDERFRARLNCEYPKLTDDDLTEEWRVHEWTNLTLVPSLLVGSVVVALWSAFQNSVIELCRYIGEREQSLLALNDLREIDLGKKTSRYIMTLTGESIVLPRTISDIQLIRNIYTYYNGSIAKLSNANTKSIQRLAASSDGVHLTGETLVLSVDYCRYCFAEIDTGLQRIMDLIYARYPVAHQGQGTD